MCDEIFDECRHRGREGAGEVRGATPGVELARFYPRGRWVGAPASLSRTGSNLGDISRDMSEIFRVYGACGCGCREGVGEAREMRK